MNRVTLDINLNSLPADPSWPSQRQDLTAALQIIARHQASSGAALPLLDAWGERPDGSLWVRLPAWWVELAETFHQRYPTAVADERLQRVLHTLLPVEAYH